MIYAPGRFLFLHVPRTAGTSITAAISKWLVGRHDCHVATGHTKWPFVRHSRACDMRERMPPAEWEQIRKFAVDRPHDEIVESDYRLHKREIQRRLKECGQADPRWLESVMKADKETLEEFRERRWGEWLKGSEPWQFFCCGRAGEDIGVTRFEYHDLADKWPAICELIGAPLLELPHLNRAEP